MKYSKIILLLTLPLFVELISSCCSCPEPIHAKYSNCGITLENLDNSGENTIIAMSDSIPKNDYGIMVALNLSLDICKTTPHSSFFISTAVACSCPNDSYTPRQGISAINIYTVNDFDTIHNANSDITDYFSVVYGDSFISIDTYLNYYDGELYGYDDYQRLFDILLTSSPTIGSKHRFKVILTLADGKEIIEETTEVILF